MIPAAEIVTETNCRTTPFGRALELKETGEIGTEFSSSTYFSTFILSEDRGTHASLLKSIPKEFPSSPFFWTADIMSNLANTKIPEAIQGRAA